MEECEGAEGKVKQSMTPPLPAAVREACLVLDAPTSSGNILDARREEELSQEAAWGEPGAGVQDLDLRRGSWGGCELSGLKAAGLLVSGAVSLPS